MDELQLYQKAYDFLLWVFNKTDGFPKSKRFSVGTRLENLFLNFIVLVNSLQYTKEKKRKLIKCSALFDEIKLMFKLCYDTKLISQKNFAFTFTDSRTSGFVHDGCAFLPCAGEIKRRYPAMPW
jgi:hypothetical protein